MSTWQHFLEVRLGTPIVSWVEPKPRPNSLNPSPTNIFAQNNQDSTLMTINQFCAITWNSQVGTLAPCRDLLTWVRLRTLCALALSITFTNFPPSLIGIFSVAHTRVTKTICASSQTGPVSYQDLGFYGSLIWNTRSLIWRQIYCYAHDLLHPYFLVNTYYPFFFCGYYIHKVKPSIDVETWWLLSYLAYKLEDSKIKTWWQLKSKIGVNKCWYGRLIAYGVSISILIDAWLSMM
jgi:hypothetical protein